MRKPTLRALTKALRELHEAGADPEYGDDYATLSYVENCHGVIGEGRILSTFGRVHPDNHALCAGREHIPDNATKFDAVAAARRLLAAARDLDDDLR